MRVFYSSRTTRASTSRPSRGPPRARSPSASWRGGGSRPTGSAPRTRPRSAASRTCGRRRGGDWWRVRHVTPVTTSHWPGTWRSGTGGSTRRSRRGRRRTRCSRRSSLRTCTASSRGQSGSAWPGRTYLLYTVYKIFLQVWLKYFCL